MPINPQILALLAQKAAEGDVDDLASLLQANVPGGPPRINAAPPQPFPVPPLDGLGTRGSLGIGRPAAPPPAILQAAPQALAAAAPQSAIGGDILGALGGIFGGGAGGATAPGSSAGPALAGGLPDGSSAAAGAAGGVNPLEALVPPTPGQQQPAPRAIGPSPGGQISPQIMQLILQALQAQRQPQIAGQPLGSLLGGLR